MLLSVSSVSSMRGSVAAGWGEGHILHQLLGWSLCLQFWRRPADGAHSPERHPVLEMRGRCAGTRHLKCRALVFRMQLAGFPGWVLCVGADLDISP